MGSDIKKIKKGLKEHFHDVLETKRNPHSIGLGFSIGAFISILPTPGFSVFLGVILILVFKKINKFAMFFAMAVFNPLTTLPLYYLSQKLGSFLLEGMPRIVFPVHLFNVVYQYSARFIVGNIIITAVISIVSYFLIKNLFIHHYKKQGHSIKEIREMLL